MADSNSDSCRYGYLLIVEDENNGYTGGYLVISEQGRPLEFHCTETVRPSRAQEILFGSTLKEFLFSEHLGAALIDASELSVDVLVVNDQDAVEAGTRLEIPTVCLNSSHDELDTRLERLAEAIDISEPFGRVREAVLEACRYHGGDASHDAA